MNFRGGGSGGGGPLVLLVDTSRCCGLPAGLPKRSAPAELEKPGMLKGSIVRLRLSSSTFGGPIGVEKGSPAIEPTIGGNGAWAAGMDVANAVDPID